MDIIVPGWDITAVNYPSRPSSGQAMLYGTGTADIKATPAMIAANPWCVLVDQSPVISGVNTSLDVFDVENGALTVNELADAIHWAVNDRVRHVRAGQRVPLAYASDSLMPEVTAALDKGRLQHMCGLFPAHWGIPDDQCRARILASANDPYPIGGMQNLNAGTFDRDLFSRDWLATSGQWNYSWTSHGQHWTLDELAVKLGIPVTALAPGNLQARDAVRQPLKVISLGAHFTYRKYPVN